MLGVSIMKLISIFCFSSLLFLFGCAKDKNLEDFRRDQLQQSISRINSASGTYTGSVISKIDGTNLGAVILRFQARTDIQPNTGGISSEQRATVSGSLIFKSLNSNEVVFDDGFYDYDSGVFQVTILRLKLSISGIVSGNKWNGTIEVQGQPDFGGEMDLTKNAPLPNTSAIEVGGTRLQQIKKMNYTYVGSYKNEGVITPFKLSFKDNDVSINSIFSPIRIVHVNCDFTDFELDFSDAILDDKAGILSGFNPIDQFGKPANATLGCLKFDQADGDFGWDCQIQTKSTMLNLHLPAKK